MTTDLAAYRRFFAEEIQRFRLDPHDADASCWCHTTLGCWSTAE